MIDKRFAIVIQFMKPGLQACDQKLLRIQISVAENRFLVRL